MSHLVDFQRRDIGLVVLVLAALTLYLTFLSRSFDEGDVFNFALALIRYDVSAHQPHPPGYPVFVFIASIPYFVTNNQLLSLTLVSALSGALTLIPTYAIANRLFNRETAFFSALALMVLPGFWLVSEQGLSDMLALLFLTLAISQLLVGSLNQSRLHLYTSWATLGIAMGVRPFNFVFIAPFLFETVRVTKRVRDHAACFMLLLGTFCLSLFPAIILTGYNQYVTAVFFQLSGHLRDEVNPLGFSALDRFVFLLLTLAREFGANPPFHILSFSPYQSDSLFANLNFVLIVLMLGFSLILLRRVKDFSKAIFILLWIIPYFAFVYLLGNPGYPRYMLPIIPPILIVLIASALRVSRSVGSCARSSKAMLGYVRVVARYVIVLLFIASVFVYSLPLAVTLHTQLPPNVQLVAFVSSNYDPMTTTVIVFHEFRAFQFFGSEFRYVHCCHEPEKAMALLKSSFRLSDSVLITGTALVALRNLGLTVSVQKVAEFFRSQLVKSKDSEAVLYRVTALG